MSDRLFQSLIASLIIVGVIAVGCIVWRFAHAPKPVAVTTTRPLPASPPASTELPLPPPVKPGHLADLKVDIGREGALHNGSERVDVAVNERSLLELVGAAQKGNVKRYDAVFAARRAFRVGDGTHVRVLGEGAYSGHVQILEGASRGRSGYVPQEWVTQ
jgi:hypothetical protein